MAELIEMPFGLRTPVGTVIAPPLPGLNLTNCGSWNWCICLLCNLVWKLLSKISEGSDDIWIAKVMPNCRPDHW